MRSIGSVMEFGLRLKMKTVGKVLFFTYSSVVNRLTDSVNRLTRVKYATGGWVCRR